MPTKVLVPIANGTEDIEVVCIIDTLRRADYDVTVASVEKSLQVTCSREIKVIADASIDDCAGQAYDLIACPGGIPGALHLRDSQTLADLLKTQAAQGKLYAAICAAPVEGKRATCFPGFASDLDNPESVADRVVIDGNCITSRGAGTAIEFALALITVISGKSKAENVGKRMLVHGYA